LARRNYVVLAIVTTLAVLSAAQARAETDAHVGLPPQGGGIQQVNCIRLGGGTIPDCDGSELQFCGQLRATVSLDTCTAAVQRWLDDYNRRQVADQSQRLAALIQKQHSGAALTIAEQLALKLNRPCPRGALPLACTSARSELVDGVAGCQSLLGLAIGISQLAKMGLSPSLIARQVPFDPNVPPSYVVAVIREATATARSRETMDNFGRRVEATCLARYGLVVR